LKHQVGLRGKNKRSSKTYGKKGKKRWEKQKRANLAQQANSPTFFDNTDMPDDGPLVRLGEGIVVDWYERAYDIVFGGDSHDEMRGAKTYTGDLPVLEDPSVAVRKRHRQMRQNNGITLDDCLDEFEKEEILSEQDTWYCPRCKEHRRASKKFDLWKSPDILVVHLKRFSSSGFRRDKLDVLVDFPVEGLDLTRRVIDKEDGKQEIYDLIGVDNHYGGLGGGHYTAFAKSFMDGDWYEYNGMFPFWWCDICSPS
jgi:ubiquitin carboxyl-terminal hydrolase 4/11